MILCIDIGNTHVVLGVYQDDLLLNSWRIRSEKDTTTDEIAVKLFSLFESASLPPSSLQRVVIASVVPQLSRVFTQFVVQYLERRPLVVKADSFPDMELLVDEPASVGADRIVNAYAAREIYGGPCIVVDFGTAITFDIVAEDGNYHGGVIAPGISLSLKSLASNTALLPSIELAAPSHVVGKNTVHAMQSGIFLGSIAMCEGLLRRVKSEMHFESVKVIGTGGFSTRIEESSSILDIVDPELTLQGLRLLSVF